MMYKHYRGFRNVKLADYCLSYNSAGRPQWGSCDFCGGPAIKLLCRTSNLTDYRHSQMICERHRREFEAEEPLFVTDEPLTWDEFRAMRDGAGIQLKLPLELPKSD